MKRKGYEVNAVILAIFALVVSTYGRDRPTVGAIRWDAWYGDGTGVNGEVEKTLSPQRWQWRAPFFAKPVAEDRVEIRGGPEDLEKEIAYAAQAGIDYWAFCIYEAEDNLSRALNLYLKSPNRHRVRFCMNLQGRHLAWGGLSRALERVDLYIEYMRRPEYQTVLDGRPLVYLFNSEQALGENGFSCDSELINFIQTLRQRTVAAGRKTPYIVLQEKSEEAAALAGRYGADAVSQYAVITQWKNQTFQQLTSYAEDHLWTQYLATGREMVPIATTGFDSRPRIQTGVSWIPDITSKSMAEYHEQPTTKELAAHLEQALAFLEEHPTAAVARTVLIYAWNEFDEGGWLCPTLGEGTARIEAVRKVLEAR